MNTGVRVVNAGAFKDHFSERSEDYASYRPHYPDALAQFLASIAPATRCALECGCGTGQFSVLLGAHFDQVVATDASAAQIENAARHTNVTYRCAPAESSGLGDGSVDLVAVAQAAHWFDLDAFYDEARRVARPGGVIALVSYGPMTVDPETDPVIGHFYRDVVGHYWPPERAHVEDGYEKLFFPFELIDPPDLAIEVDWSLKAFLGYVGTWSSVGNARKAMAQDPMHDFANDLGAVWGDGDKVRRVRWPLKVKAGRIS